MPPLVAHAPIVTRYLDARRIRWMRSSSCGVVMEPSTSERSYGPFTIHREASAKFATSTLSAIASSSSSQSSNVNWQPSHDANFHTASLGLGLGSISQLPNSQPMLDAVVAKNRAVLADELRAKLAVPAKTDGALHIALHGEKNPLVTDAAFLQFEHGVAHHNFRSTDHGNCI